MLLDAHIHIKDSSSFFPADAIFFVNSTIPDEWEMVVRYSQTNKNVIPFLGIHPWNLEKAQTGWEVLLKELLVKNPDTGIGEIGLDKLKKTPVDLQIAFFKKQFEIALSLNRPVSIHCVKSFEILFEIFEEYKLKTLNGILHRFEGSKKEMYTLLKYGLYISFFYSLHFREKVKEAFIECPIDRVFLESDAGNGPELLKLKEHYVRASILKNIEFETFQKKIVENGQIFKNSSFNR